MAKKSALSESTVTAAIDALEIRIGAQDSGGDIDSMQVIFDARAELLALRGEGNGAPKKTRSSRRRGLPEQPAPVSEA